MRPQWGSSPAAGAPAAPMGKLSRLRAPLLSPLGPPLSLRRSVADSPSPPLLSFPGSSRSSLLPASPLGPLVPLGAPLGAPLRAPLGAVQEPREPREPFRMPQLQKGSHDWTSF